MYHRLQQLEIHVSVVGDPALLETGRQRLRELRTCRPPGLAVDEVVEELLAEGAAGVLAQLDGIVRVAGASPGGDGWLTVVAHPRGHFASAVLRLESGAVATVAQPGSEDLLAVSVIAGAAWEAEVLASTALAAGSDSTAEGAPGGADAAERVLRTAGVPGLLIDAYDEVRAVNGWDQHSAAMHGRILAPA